MFNIFKSTAYNEMFNLLFKFTKKWSIPIRTKIKDLSS